VVIRSTRWWLIGALVTATIAVLYLCVPLAAQKVLVDKASARNLTVIAVRPTIGLKGLWFNGLELSSRNVERIRVHLGPTCVRWSSIGGILNIEIHGGKISLNGSPKELAQAVGSRRVDGETSNKREPQSFKTELYDFAIDWRHNSDATRFCTVSGLNLKWNSADSSAKFGQVRCGIGATVIEVRDGNWTFQEPSQKAADSTATLPSSGDDALLRRPWSVDAGVIRIEVGFGSASESQKTVGVLQLDDGASAHAKTSEQVVPVRHQTKITDRNARGAAMAGLAASKEELELGVLNNSTNANGSVASRFDLNGFSVRRLRDILTFVDPEYRETLNKVPFGSKVSSHQVSLRIRSDGQKLDLGPWVFRSERDLEVTIAEFTQNDAESKAALNARLKILTKEQRSEFLVAIGPVSLNRLGVSTGDFGLEGIENTNVQLTTTAKLDSKSPNVTLESRGEIGNLSFRQPWFAKNTVSGLNLNWEGRVTLDLVKSRLRTEELHFAIGKVSARIHGEVDFHQENPSIQGTLEVPLAACQDFFDALPNGFSPLLGNWRVDGTFGLSTSLSYDPKAPDSSVVRLALDNHCRIRSVPHDVAPSKFEQPFVLEVEDEKGQFQSVSFGPGAWTWTPLSEISPYVESAVLVCEDGRFLHHSGFDIEAIQNSIRDNLRSGRFARGASTVSMQLAKNLYLRRDKTVSRKLQEAALTMLLEQSFSKRQMLELYLNVIEYGAGIYGIGPAARHYFDTTPDRLTLVQSFFLISLLPNPKANHFGADGYVSPGWLKQLRWLMGIGAKRGHFTQTELETGLAEQPAFRVPGNPVATPSRRITNDLASDDASLLPAMPE
jgi:hypothetical protein